MGGLRRSECPGGRVMLWLWGANPHITPPTPHVRVVGHTIDRCIISMQSNIASYLNRLSSLKSL